jgi:conjugative transfer signal peptidase TraF
MKIGISLGLLFALAVITSLLKYGGYGLTYQFSASMPEGWYWLSPVGQLERGDTVTFMPPPATAALMVKRQWLGPDMAMMKHIKAMPGDFVCRQDNALYINNHYVGAIAKVDEQGRPLPQLHYCQALPSHQYMLMSTRVPNSFDSRYFGPVDRNRIINKATKLSG